MHSSLAPITYSTWIEAARFYPPYRATHSGVVG